MPPPNVSQKRIDDCYATTITVSDFDNPPDADGVQAGSSLDPGLDLNPSAPAFVPTVRDPVSTRSKSAVGSTDPATTKLPKQRPNKSTKNGQTRRSLPVRTCAKSKKQSLFPSIRSYTKKFAKASKRRQKVKKPPTSLPP